MVSLHKSRESREKGVFLIEGVRELEKAVKAGYHLTSLFYCPELISIEYLKIFSGKTTEVYTITKEVFQRITYRGNSGGLIATAKRKEHHIIGLQLNKNPLLLILESVEKPGNLGAILRTADAAGVDAVIVCDQQTDLYNSNVIRSSLGCIFTIPVFVGSSAEVIDLLKANEIKIYCTSLLASVPYYTIDFTISAAIIMGAEATGLTPIWLDHSDQNIVIPMRGNVDSLNVSTSAAIVIFEAMKQRRFEKSKRTKSNLSK